MQVYFELRDNKRLATSVSPASSPVCSSKAECELPRPTNLLFHWCQRSKNAWLSQSGVLVSATLLSSGPRALIERAIFNCSSSSDFVKGAVRYKSLAFAPDGLFWLDVGNTIPWFSRHSLKGFSRQVRFFTRDMVDVDPVSAALTASCRQDIIWCLGGILPFKFFLQYDSSRNTCFLNKLGFWPRSKCLSIAMISFSRRLTIDERTFSAAFFLFCNSASSFVLTDWYLSIASFVFFELICPGCCFSSPRLKTFKDARAHPFLLLPIFQ